MPHPSTHGQKSGRMPLRALLGSTHPGPALAVTLIAVVLAIGVGADPWRVALLGLVIALGQASIGLSNDWLDADRDRAVGRRDKPVARGAVSAATVRSAAFVTLGLALLLAVPLGPAAAVAHAVFLASAWAYNLGLKRTALSVLPYLLSFGLLPAIVTLALAESRPAALWALTLGALLGAAAHFANVLPDLDDDRATGVRGLPHRLGATTSGIITFVLLLAASGVGVVGPGLPPEAALWLGLAANVAIAAVGIRLVLTRPPGRILFRLIIVAALIDVVMLASAGGAVVA